MASSQKYRSETVRSFIYALLVLVSPALIERVSWENSKVIVALTREAIQNGPAYDESLPITREYENRLYFHYGRPPYWLREAESWPSVSRAGLST